MIFPEALETALSRECRSAARGLLRSPGFSAVAILTLALGVAATTAVFSGVDALLIRPLPYPTGDRLVQVHATNPGRGWRRVPVSPLDFLDWREQNESFERISAGRFWFYTLAGDGEPERIHGMRVTPGYFASLGVRPTLGRAFRRDEEQPGRDRVALLTHGLWERRFAADPAVVGRRITVDSVPVTVVGVLPEDFWFYPVLGEPIELWMPLALDRAALSREARSVFVHGLLKPGISLVHAQAEMETIADRLAREHPRENLGWSAEVEAGLLSKEAIRPQLLLLSAAVALVLLIACANVANLMLARAMHRRREFALRAALGATRARLFLQGAFEGVLLAGVACAAGVLLASASWRVLIPLLTPRIEPFFYGGIDPDGLDLRVLVFALGTSLLAGVPAGLVWVPTAQRQMGGLLRGGETGTLGSSGVGWTSRLLLVVQIALAVMLSIGAGLMMRSLQALHQVDRGLDLRGALTAQVWPSEGRYAEPHAVAAFHRRVLDEIQGLPGVAAASAVNFLPLGELAVGGTFEIEGRSSPPEDRPNALYYTVAPGFFRVLRIPLLSGRALDAGDAAGAPAVAVVDVRLAERYWPDGDPVGKRFRFDPPDSDSPWAAHLTRGWVTVVGVASAIRADGLFEAASPVLYLPASQNPSQMMHLVVRTRRGDPLGLPRALRRAVRHVDDGQPVSFIRPMEEVSEWAVSGRRLAMQLLVIFAVVAVVLASTGVYAVVSYSVSRRTREMGIRMALGAQRSRIVTLVVGEGLRLAMTGVAVGAAAAIASARVLAHQLFGVTATDPATFVSTCFLLVGIAGLASYVAGRRASRLDPMTALAAR